MALPITKQDLEAALVTAAYKYPPTYLLLSQSLKFLLESLCLVVGHIAHATPSALTKVLVNTRLTLNPAAVTLTNHG